MVVSYDQSVAGSDAIADSDGNEVASFTTGEDGVPAVTNASAEVAPLTAPTALTATAYGATIIDLAWTAPDDDGGSAITGYKIEVSTDGSSGTWSDLVADTESTNTRYRHTGLSNGNTRHYRLRFPLFPRSSISTVTGPTCRLKRPAPRPVFKKNRSAPMRSE